MSIPQLYDVYETIEEPEALDYMLTANAEVIRRIFGFDRAMPLHIKLECEAQTFCVVYLINPSPGSAYAGAISICKSTVAVNS